MSCYQSYYQVVSLNRLIEDADGREVELAELLSSGYNLELDIIQRELLSELPFRVVEIGEKLLDRTPLSKSEKIYIHNFRQRYKGTIPL